MPEPITLTAVAGYLVGQIGNAICNVVASQVDRRWVESFIQDRSSNHDVQRALRTAWQRASTSVFDLYRTTVGYDQIEPDERATVEARAELFLDPKIADAVFEVTNSGWSLDTARLDASQGTSLAINDPAWIHLLDHDRANAWLIAALGHLGLIEELPGSLQRLLHENLLNALAFHFMEVAIKHTAEARDALFYQQFITLRHTLGQAQDTRDAQWIEVQAKLQELDDCRRWQEVLLSLDQIEATISRIDIKVGKVLGEGTLRPYLEVMAVHGEDYDELVDWPILGELGREAADLLFVDEDALYAIDRRLTAATARRNVLAANAGRGKTVLSRVIAHRKYESGWGVYFIDVREVDAGQLEVLVKSIDQVAAQASRGLLIVVENAHLSDEVTERIVAVADRFAMSSAHRRCHFLFNTRDFVRDPDLDPFREWKRLGLCYQVEPGEALIDGIIDMFLSANGRTYALSERDRQWIRTHLLLGDTGKDGHGGGDLRLLRLYLMAWSTIGGELHQLDESDILASLKRFLLVRELSREEPLADLLGRVSTVFQFDVPFFGRRTNYSDSRAYIADLDELRKRGRIKYLGRDFFALAHSIDAYYVSWCLASHHGESHEDYSARLVGEYISELPSSPTNVVVDNLLKLFRSLYGHGSRHFSSAVFRSIYSERQELIVTLVTKHALGVGVPGGRYFEGLGLTVRILDLVDLYLGQDEAIDLWERVLDRVEHRHWAAVLKRNKPFFIDQLIKILMRISVSEVMTERYLEAILIDFDEIFSTSSLHKVNEMFKHLPDPIVARLINKIDPAAYAGKILLSKPIYLDFALTTLNDEYARDVFGYIRDQRLDEFLEFLGNDTTYRKTLIGRMRGIDPVLEATVSRRLKPRFEHLRNREDSRRRTDDGRMLITNKIANNYIHGLISSDFRNHLSENFEDGFVSAIDNPKVLNRLVNAIIRATDGYPQQKQGQQIIAELVYQMEDETLSQVCADWKLMGLIRGSSSSDAYEYLVERCGELA